MGLNIKWPDILSIVKNPLYQKDGTFSKTAFLLVNTWIWVIFKYIFDGLTIHIIKFGIDYTHVIKFDSTAALALLGTSMSLYFTNHNIKFMPKGIAETVHTPIQE